MLKLSDDVIRIDAEDDTAMRWIQAQLAVHDNGNWSTGVLTPTMRNGVYQKVTNAGAFRLTPPRESGEMLILLVNGSAAGTVTTSDFDKVTGSSLTTTSGHAFIGAVRVIETWSWLNWQAMQ